MRITVLWDMTNLISNFYFVIVVVVLLEIGFFYCSTPAFATVSFDYDGSSIESYFIEHGAKITINDSTAFTSGIDTIQVTLTQGGHTLGPLPFRETSATSNSYVLSNGNNPNNYFVKFTTLPSDPNVPQLQVDNPTSPSDPKTIVISYQHGQTTYTNPDNSLLVIYPITDTLPTTFPNPPSWNTVISCSSYHNDQDSDGICNDWEDPTSAVFTNCSIKSGLCIPNAVSGTFYNIGCGSDNPEDPVCPNKNQREDINQIL